MYVLTMFALNMFDVKAWARCLSESELGLRGGLSSLFPAAVFF